MGYASFPPARRARRRRRILVALVGVLIVAVGVFAARYRTEARGVADYVAVTESAVELQAQAATELEATFLSLSTIDRPELLRRLAEMHATTVEAANAIGTVAVPASVAEAHGYLMVAARSWEQALGLLDEAVVAVVDESGGSGSSEALEEALVLLKVGDTAYAQFLARADSFDDAIAGGDFAAFAFTSFDGVVRFDPGTVSTRLAAVYQLGSRRNISVSALTDPEVIGERNGVPVVPFSEHFVVQAVIANEGNETEEQVSVVLELIATNRDEAPITITQTIASLTPGEAKTCIFDGIELTPGGLYELIIRAIVVDDASPDDNAWQMVFYRNENA
jgi:hypothetical protein